MVYVAVERRFLNAIGSNILFGVQLDDLLIVFSVFLILVLVNRAHARGIVNLLLLSHCLRRDDLRKALQARSL